MPDKNQEQAPPEIIYTEDDIDNFSFSQNTDASYFEKAQDFKQLIRNLRIDYLGLKAHQSQDANGATITTYIRDKNKSIGINAEGVDATIRFLVPRLGKHIVLSSWSEERMYAVLLDDMNTWFWMNVQNMEKYQIQEGVMEELRILINDLLENAYRRPIDDKERGTMIPFSKEVRRLMGMGDDDRRDDGQQPKYPTQVLDDMRKEAKNGY
jgi:hypothetical protein